MTLPWLFEAGALADGFASGMGWAGFWLGLGIALHGLFRGVKLD